MATVPFSDWLPEVLPFVPGCPEPLAENAIRNACIYFCTSTNWWQGDYGPVDLTAADLPYDFPALPTGVYATQIMNAEIDELSPPLAITSIQELTNKIVNWRSQTGQPRAVFQPSPATVSFYPIPAGTDSYSIFFRLAFAPLRTATTIEDTVLQDFLEEIAAGALQRLMDVPNQPWTNPEEAKRFSSIFTRAITIAQTEAAKSYGRQAQMIQLRHG